MVYNHPTDPRDLVMARNYGSAAFTLMLVALAAWVVLHVV